MSLKLSVNILLALALLTSANVYSASDSKAAGVETVFVTYSGPSEIKSEMEQETFTVFYVIIRLGVGVDGDVDSEQAEIDIPVALYDKDWFWTRKQLGHTTATIPKGKPGTIFAGAVKLQLSCDENNNVIGSGENTAEIYAVVNGKKSIPQKVTCK